MLRDFRGSPFHYYLLSLYLARAHSLLPRKPRLLSVTGAVTVVVAFGFGAFFFFSLEMNAG